MIDEIPIIKEVAEPAFELVGTEADATKGATMLIQPYESPLLVRLWKEREVVQPSADIEFIGQFDPKMTAGGSFRAIAGSVGDGRVRIDTMYFPANSTIKLQAVTVDGLRSNVLLVILAGEEPKYDEPFIPDGSG